MPADETAQTDETAERPAAAEAAAAEEAAAEEAKPKPKSKPKPKPKPKPKNGAGEEAAAAAVDAAVAAEEAAAAAVGPVELVAMGNPRRTACMRGGECVASVWKVGERFIVMARDGRAPLTSGRHTTLRAAVKAAGL